MEGKQSRYISRCDPRTVELRELEGVSVRPVATPDDRQAVMDLRATAYGPKYFGRAKEATDALDDLPSATLLLAFRPDGRPAGTLRVLDRAKGALELDHFVEVDELLAPIADPLSATEATRLAVPRGRGAKVTKLALWKAFFQYSLDKCRITLLVWGRPPAARQYRSLLFADLGSAGAFRHPRLGTENRTLLMDMRLASDRLRDAAHPLYEFFFKMRHPRVRYE